MPKQPKLTDMQLVLLSTASQRADGKRLFSCLRGSKSPDPGLETGSLRLHAPLPDYEKKRSAT